MQPQDIFEHKLKWRPGFTVDVHSDLDTRCKTWCKRNVARHQWAFDSWIAPYAHRFLFETKKDAQKFYKEFKEWIDD